MKVKMTVESADLRVGNATIRLVPSGGEGNNNPFFVPLTQGNGNPSFVLTLTNKESFGSFLPGTEVQVSFETLTEGEKITPSPKSTP